MEVELLHIVGTQGMLLPFPSYKFNCYFKQLNMYQSFSLNTLMVKY